MHWALRDIVSSMGIWLDPQTVCDRLSGEHLPQDKRNDWADCFKYVSNKIHMWLEIKKEFAA
jgi:hypothetical protein